MAHPGYPPPRLPKPPIASTDLWVSIGALIVTVAFGVVAAAMGLFSLAFLDYCPPESCSAEGAATAVGTALLAAFAIGVVGLLVTVVQLYRRKPGWPFCGRNFCVVRDRGRAGRRRLRDRRRRLTPCRAKPAPGPGLFAYGCQGGTRPSESPRACAR